MYVCSKMPVIICDIAIFMAIPPSFDWWSIVLKQNCLNIYNNNIILIHCRSSYRMRIDSHV